MTQKTEGSMGVLIVGLTPTEEVGGHGATENGGWWCSVTEGTVFQRLSDNNELWDRLLNDLPSWRDG